MPTILIVDDEAVDREMAERCLDSLNDLTVLTAGDGEEALARIERAVPDLVLTDLRMPGMDGLELVKRLQQDHALLPVILITSHGSEHAAVEALKAGAASYVAKKEMKTALLDTVEQTLDTISARQSRETILKRLDHREMLFTLDNDLKLISPMAALAQESLEAVHLGDDSLRARVSMALTEALSNAIIHGNLEVSSDLRENGTQPYFELIRQRQQEEPYASREVRVIINENSERVEYAVMDDGPGFDTAGLPNPTDLENVVRTRGRGLMLIRTFMDDVRHNEQGNMIVMTKKLESS